MKLEHAKAIQRAALSTLGFDVDVRESYSGRGMYGMSTAAVVGRQGEILQSIALAAADLAVKDYDSAMEFVEDMGLRFDGMGHDIVVY